MQTRPRSADRRRDFAQLKSLQTFRKAGEFKCRSIRFPNHSSVLQDTNHRSRSAPAKRLHSISCAERSGFAKRLDDGNHGVAIQNTGDIVRDSGGEFASAGRLKIGKNDITSSTAYVGECVSVEEKKRGGFVKGSKEIECFDQGNFNQTLFFPASRARVSNLWISAVLRSTSFARCSIEADDKLPVPVFEKSGSGL